MTIVVRLGLVYLFGFAFYLARGHGAPTAALSSVVTLVLALLLVYALELIAPVDDDDD